MVSNILAHRIDCNSFSFSFYSHDNSLTQLPKYTLSRKSRNDPDGRPGIGWTDEGLAKFNQLGKIWSKIVTGVQTCALPICRDLRDNVYFGSCVKE